MNVVFIVNLVTKAQNPMDDDNIGTVPKSKSIDTVRRIDSLVSSHKLLLNCVFIITWVVYFFTIDRGEKDARRKQRGVLKESLK